jgi:acyl-CoA thioester hydrolase
VIELARSTVQTWDVDVMGHMNIQLYYERTFDALAALGTEIGLGPRRLARDGLRFRILNQHSRFLSELRQGSIYHVRGVVAAQADAALTLYTELVNSMTGDVSATMRTDCELVSTSGPVLLGPDEAAKAVELSGTIPPHGLPRGLAPDRARRVPSIAETERLGFARTYQGVVKSQECDGDGVIQPRYVTGHVINAIPHLQQQTVPDASGTQRRGGAAVESTIRYLKLPRAGDVVTARSAITFVGDRHYCWLHWLFDLETGEALAAQESVSIPLDLVERRAMPLTEEFQQRLRSRLTADA